MFTGLSCYTANLLAYLDSCDDTALDRFAGSVRLAVAVDEPAFSHHRTPLDVLPDGTVLRYARASSAEETVRELDAELAAHGRVIVVTDNSRLPWSPSYGTDASAPHWLLVDGRVGESWHVVDHFGGLLPTGEQHPFEGVMGTDALLYAMGGPERWSAMQVRRNALAFGHPVEVPAGGWRWLRRERGAASGPRLDYPTRVRQFVGVGEALPFLAEWFCRDPVGASDVLDDLWSASGHHVFRYLRAGELEAADAWRRLPGALRFAVDSARRGRPRESLVQLTFRNLLHIESGQDGVLPSRGRTAR
ncbi:hypothetical protein ACQPW3_26925 [Actinosynnema sp. CA-248983]